jgi:hypothetical protein
MSPGVTNFAVVESDSIELHRQPKVRGAQIHRCGGDTAVEGAGSTAW